MNAVEIYGVLLASALLIYLYLKWTRQYWTKRNVPQLESHLIWGNLENPLFDNKGLGIRIQEAYKEFKKRGDKHGGIYLFTRVGYIPIDPELIKHIMANDFSHFTGHGIAVNKEREPLLAHLFTLDGEEWRNMRVQLTPTFTSGKMKMMFNTLLECGVPMIEHIDKLTKAGKSLDIKEILACYTTDIIGSCAFGIECDSFKNPDAEFRRYGRQVFEPNFSIKLTQFIAFVIPAINKLFYIRRLSMDLETFYINIVKNIIGYRETTNSKRNDFIQLLMELNEKAKASGKKGFTIEEMAAQSFVFFLAGFETSSSTMTVCLHELAFNQDIQETLRKEIKESLKKYDGKLTYECVMEMKYMDKVVMETLRKYPTLHMLTRRCNKKYKVPNTNTVIDEGTTVFISALGIHRDEEYYPNPNKFDPERFNEENKAKRHPFTFLPFGEGPRMCIGLRFGLMQTKTGLAMLLDKYRILPAKGETYEIDFDARSFIVATKKGKTMLDAEALVK